MAVIIDKSKAGHYTWGDHCDSWLLADTEGLSVKQERMPPSSREKLHFHSTAQQFFYVLHGTASFFTGNNKNVLTAEQGILIEPGVKHYIANESDEPLDFLVISQPSTNNDRTTVEE